MITAALTEIPGSSSVLSRGFVTYSNQSKIDMLGVKLKTLELHGAVSGQTVSEMASGAITASNGEADYAIAVSGVAGPDGGNKEKPVGLVYICILKKGEVGEIKKYIFRGDRQSVRYQTVMRALDNLTQLV
jgi:nicotinamide-nucleotide amidase